MERRRKVNVSEMLKVRGCRWSVEGVAGGEAGLQGQEVWTGARRLRCRRRSR